MHTRFHKQETKNKGKKFKGPKVAGGLGVFVREEIDHLVQVVPNDNDDSIWIRMKKEVVDENEDVYLGTYYVSPYNKGKKTMISSMKLITK